MQSDPYRPPAAKIGDASSRPRKLYSTNQIALATLLGSVAAGCFLMAQNFATLDRFSARLGTLASGLAGALALIGVGAALPDIPGLRLGLNLASMVLIRTLAQDMQGDEIETRLCGGAELHSIWWALLVSLVFLVLVTFALFLAALALVAWSYLP